MSIYEKVKQKNEQKLQWTLSLCSVSVSVDSMVYIVSHNAIVIFPK